MNQILPLAFLAALAFSQGAASRPASKPAPPAWPKLSSAESAELGQAIDTLKRTPTPEGVDQMVEKIVGFGKGAIPYLLESISRQKPVPEDELTEDAIRLGKALEAVVGAEDAPRLALECASRSPLVRRFALRKVGQYGVMDALPAVKKALADPDDDARFEAALTTASLGTIDGLDVLRRTARDQWPRYGKRVRAAVERHRSPEATQKLLPGLKAKEWQDVCSSLRLLAGWGTKDCATDVKPLLDTTDHRIKEDAINALRGIVENQPALEKLSAFDLAEQANAWKKKV
jgi:HEAT repeat protein